MNPKELMEIIENGESSTIQLKERVNNPYQIGTEMVAFANHRGGKIIIGVCDKTGEIKGMNFQDIQKTNQLLANASDNNVKPPVYIDTETVKVGDDRVIVVTVPEALSKPVLDNKGIAWIKNGADKRRVTSQDEMRRLFQQSGLLLADEQIVENSSAEDINRKILNLLLEKKTGQFVEEIDIPLSRQLQNLRFLSGENLTLAGLLLLSDHVQKYRPLFTVKCVSFLGTEISSSGFRDRPDPFQGHLRALFDQSMAFLKRNLRMVQIEEGFNTRPELEISVSTLEELVVNALVHRNYYIQSAIRIFIFDDRVEIISPGTLPNTLTIENVKAGISMGRNPSLYSNAPYILPLVGVGTGIPRALKNTPNMELVNDEDRELFIARIFRNSA